MKYIIITISSIFSVMLFAQHGDEDFLNKIIRLEKYKSCDSILLLLDKSKLYLSQENIAELKTEIPKVILDELVEKNKELRKKNLTWNISEINQAKGVNRKDSLGFALYNNFAVSDSLFKAEYHLDTISDWKILETKIDSLAEKGIYSSNFSSFTHCYRYTSIYSYPLISENGKWAIIEHVKYVRSLNATGAICIYKKKRKKWKLIGTVGNWAS